MNEKKGLNEMELNEKHGRISWKGSYEIALFFARSLEETTPVSTNQIATHPHGPSLRTEQDVIAVVSSTVTRKPSRLNTY